MSKLFKVEYLVNADIRYETEVYADSEEEAMNQIKNGGVTICENDDEQDWNTNEVKVLGATLEEDDEYDEDEDDEDE